MTPDAGTWVKLCGCTSWDDVALAIDARADAFGMIFAPSPRRIAWEAARDVARRVPAGVAPVAVFVNPTLEDVDGVRALFPQALLQFSGSESPDFVRRYGDRAIKAVHVAAESGDAELDARCAAYGDVTLLLDTARAGLAGGTGTAFDWSRVRTLAAKRRVVVAGGLLPETVGACVRALRPFGVDVRSGVESAGRKDAAKMRAFVRAVRDADAA